MKIAVITAIGPNYNLNWLTQCVRSVQEQDSSFAEIEHYLIYDGAAEMDFFLAPTIPIRLPDCSNDWGNTPKAIGTILAFKTKCDLCIYLDCDNWLNPEHLRRLIEEVEKFPKSDMFSHGRELFADNGMYIGKCPQTVEVSGKVYFADVNTLVIRRSMMLEMSQVWASHPGNGVDWDITSAYRHQIKYLPIKSVNYRTRWKTHFTHYGLTPPENAK